MPSVFISYRRKDSDSDVDRLFDRLASRFGRSSVFLDVNTLPPGDEYAETIREQLARSDSLIAVIGPAWLRAGAPAARRLEDPDDLLRMEIATALDGISVVPVLVAGASMPEEHELPEPLHGLRARQAVEGRPDPVGTGRWTISRHRSSSTRLAALSPAEHHRIRHRRRSVRRRIRPGRRFARSRFNARPANFRRRCRTSRCDSPTRPRSHRLRGHGGSTRHCRYSPEAPRLSCARQRTERLLHRRQHHDRFTHRRWTRCGMPQPSAPGRRRGGTASTCEVRKPSSSTRVSCSTERSNACTPRTNSSEHLLGNVASSGSADRTTTTSCECASVRVPFRSNVRSSSTAIRRPNSRNRRESKPATSSTGAGCCIARRSSSTSPRSECSKSRVHSVVRGPGRGA